MRLLVSTLIWFGLGFAVTELVADGMARWRPQVRLVGEVASAPPSVLGFVAQEK